jgi:hypothetical protein
MSRTSRAAAPCEAKAGLIAVVNSRKPERSAETGRRFWRNIKGSTETVVILLAPVCFGRYG